ncbi:SH3 domain-containing protein [Geobacter pickeringii]|uniref:Uncharacterized protein n=1 Tax=Geobacter pickeringii TaxID=345632 RepID=A0A0B5BJ67_9BACT|nr:hypothetical protein [Geobacter pickeringii]AJE04520.1 hypothetical protein GPICK_15165 [Geobacter pickeringii]
MRFFAVLLVTVFLWGEAGAAPRSPRPEAGIGILFIRPPPADRDGGSPLVVLYREPGVSRIGEWRAASLPLLSLPAEEGGGIPVAVMAKRGAWFRVAYDDAGRSGWVEGERVWSFLPWDEYLKGKGIRLLPGLRKPYYILRAGPVDHAPELRTLSPENSLRVIEVAGDRARVILDLAVMGWLSWRDEDGRLLVGVR